MKLGLIFERYRQLNSSRNLKEPGGKNRVFDLGTIAKLIRYETKQEVHCMHQLAISFTKNGLPGPDRSIVGFRINYNGLKFIRSIERPAENTH